MNLHPVNPFPAKIPIALLRSGIVPPGSGCSAVSWDPWCCGRQTLVVALEESKTWPATERRSPGMANSSLAHPTRA